MAVDAYQDSISEEDQIVPKKKKKMSSGTTSELFQDLQTGRAILFRLSSLLGNLELFKTI